jgi:branched-chain amino acid aminotransferase
MTNNRLIWLNGEIVKVEDAKINVLAPTAQFGANVFEGIRCYWNDEKQELYAFRLNDHYKRLLNSMKMFRMEMKFTIDDFKNALLEVVTANGYKEDIAVRQTVFVDGFGSWFAEGPIGMFVAPIPKGRTLVEGKKGYSACVSSWERISDRNLSPRVKVGANYINSRMAQLEAKQNGYDTAIFMNNQGKISEGPGSCIFIVRDGILYTPLLTDSVLESITRDTVIKIAKDLLNITVIERSIDRTELYIADELFLCGSAMEIVKIVKIDGYSLENNNFTITDKLTIMYFNIVRGKVRFNDDWITLIYE